MVSKISNRLQAILLWRGFSPYKNIIIHKIKHESKN